MITTNNKNRMATMNIGGRQIQVEKGVDNALYAKGYGQEKPQTNAKAIYETGLEQNKQASRDVQYDWNGNNKNGVIFSGVQTQYMPNGNPVALGGKAKMTIGGQEFDVPNAVAQMQTYTQAYNQGRYQPFENLSENAVKEQAKKLGVGDNFYTSYGALKGQLNSWFNRNPQWQEGKPLNEYYANLAKSDQIQQEIIDEKKKNSFVTETASPSGITSSTYMNNENVINKLNNELNLLSSQRNDRAFKNKNYGRSGMEGVADINATIENYRPTISNLPIEETFISK